MANSSFIRPPEATVLRPRDSVEQGVTPTFSRVPQEDINVAPQQPGAQLQGLNSSMAHHGDSFSSGRRSSPTRENSSISVASASQVWSSSIHSKRAELVNEISAAIEAAEAVQTCFGSNSGDPSTMDPNLLKLPSTIPEEDGFNV